MCKATHGPVAVYIPCILCLHTQHVITDRIHGQYQNMQDWYVKQAVMNSSKRVVCMYRSYQTLAMKCGML